MIKLGNKNLTINPGKVYGLGMGYKVQDVEKQSLIVARDVIVDEVIYISFSITLEESKRVIEACIRKLHLTNSEIEKKCLQI